MNHPLRLFLLTFFLSLAPLSAGADPPGRVGRLSHLSGDVALRAADADDWEDAQLNRPITGGDLLSTGPGSRAEVRIGSTAIRLDSGTDLAFARLDDERIRLRLLQGTMSVRIRSREQAAEFDIDTHWGRVLPEQPGRYRLEAGGDRGAIAALDGALLLEAPSASLKVRAGERLEIDGTERPYFRTTAVRPDEFDDWAFARDRRDDASKSVRYVSAEMTGYEDLDDYGVWRETDEYGPVWMPRELPADWAPYRSGRWVSIEPWGWTWVDEMPWGFAPFHYGRWALVGGAWAWVPGAVVARPVYAPALVAWVGGSGWSISVASGSVAAVGWFPLAPRELYVPAHRCSPTYVKSVNVTHVTNITRMASAGDIDVTRIRYAHREVPRALTVVPARTLAEGRQVGKEAVPMRQRREIADLPFTRVAPNVQPLRRAAIEQRRERPGPSLGRPVVDSPSAPGSAAAPAERGPRRDRDTDRREGEAGAERAGSAAVPTVRPEPRPDMPDRGRAERRAFPEPSQAEPRAVERPLGSHRYEAGEQRRIEEREPRRARAAVPQPAHPAPTERTVPREMPPQAAPPGPERQERQHRIDAQPRQQQRIGEQPRQLKRIEEQPGQQRIEEQPRQQRQRSDAAETAGRRAEPPASPQPAPPAPHRLGRTHEQRGMEAPRGVEGMRGMDSPRGSPKLNEAPARKGGGAD
jgi:hypothetical protein